MTHMRVYAFPKIGELPVRIFLDGEVVLHIPPLARPMIWRNFEMEAQDADGIGKPVMGRPFTANEHTTQ